MISKLYQKSLSLTPSSVKLAFFLLTIVLFVLGAGAPGDGGGFGGG